MMKMMSLLVASLALVSLKADAGCGKCPIDKTAAKEAAVCPVTGQSGDAATIGLKLTEDQKAKIAALKQDCAKATCTSECKAKCEAGMAKILDAEQFKLWQASADKCVKSAKTEDKVQKKDCCPGH